MYWWRATGRKITGAGPPVPQTLWVHFTQPRDPWSAVQSCWVGSDCLLWLIQYEGLMMGVWLHWAREHDLQRPWEESERSREAELGGISETLKIQVPSRCHYFTDETEVHRGGKDLFKAADEARGEMGCAASSQFFPAPCQALSPSLPVECC